VEKAEVVVRRVRVKGVHQVLVLQEKQGMEVREEK
jgi:hypothetical protein